MHNIGMICSFTAIFSKSRRIRFDFSIMVSIPVSGYCENKACRPLPSLGIKTDMANAGVTTVNGNKYSQILFYPELISRRYRFQSVRLLV